MNICKNGHANQAGGCCCPDCGNTCGYHYEYTYTGCTQSFLPSGRKSETIGTIEQLAAFSPEWERRLKDQGYLPDSPDT